MQAQPAPRPRRTGALFLPLDTPPYLKFEARIKTAEVRTDLSKWGPHIIYEGRQVIARRGYGVTVDTFTSTIGRIHRGTVDTWPEWAHQAAALHTPVPNENDWRYRTWLKRVAKNPRPYFDATKSLVVFEHLNVTFQNPALNATARAEA